MQLAGCGGGGGLASSTTAAAFTGNNVTSVVGSLRQTQTDSVNENAVGRVVYGVGINNVAGQFVTEAGYNVSGSVGVPVTTGTATYDANYGYAVGDQVERTSSIIRGYANRESGPITLTANFDSGTLTGTGSELTVNGTISGRAVGGSAVANYSYPRITAGGIQTVTGTVNTTITGEIGASGVIGAFRGTDPDTTVAGGFVGVSR